MAEVHLGREVAAEMAVTAPKTLPATSTVQAVRDALADDHVHLVLLVAGNRLVGTLARTDVPATAADHDPAVVHSRLRGRTVAPRTPVRRARHTLLRTGQRRLAVVDRRGRLRGLLCLRADGRGFCTDTGVAARGRDRTRTDRSAPTGDHP